MSNHHTVTYQIHHLDQAALAYDQRCVPVAIGRYLVLAGLVFIFFMEGVFVWTGIGAILYGVMLAFPFRQPRNRWINIVGGGLTVIAGLLFLGQAVYLLLPSAQIMPVDFSMKADFLEALARLNSQYNSASWMVTRIVIAIFTGLMGIELLLAGWFLARLKPVDSCLLAERAKGKITPLLSWLLDVSPGFLGYYKRFPGFLLFPLGMLFFLVTAAGIAGAAGINNILANGDLANCFDEIVNKNKCIDSIGDATLLRTIFFIVFFFSLPQIGLLILGYAQKKAANTAAERLSNDDRPPILFLRTFSDDQVNLPPSTWTPMRYALAPTSHVKPPLDHLLLGEFMEIGPPRAIGRPKEKRGEFRPFGALRIYEKDWKPEVLKRAEEWARVVLVFDESIDETAKEQDGIGWELENMGKPNLRTKTIFLAHPDLGNRQKNETEAARLQRNREYWIKAGQIAGFSVPETTSPLLSLFIDSNGTYFITTATRFTATTVLLALRATFIRSGLM